MKINETTGNHRPQGGDQSTNTVNTNENHRDSQVLLPQGEGESNGNQLKPFIESTVQIREPHRHYKQSPTGTTGGEPGKA